MGGLTVLITNNTLANRAGSELYVRDIATALLKRGHTPIAFSTVLGDVARELREATIPVIDSLDALTTPPDIIHGQHHVETMMALLHFPSTPAIYFCHGWIPWEEAPPRFPRILKYVAVDYTCRDRLVLENAIPKERVDVLLNFVDLERFKPRAPLPLRPVRALIFSNNANEQTHVRAVRDACERAGIALDVMGLSSGNPIAEPEKVLGDYDIVFAKARAALEAMSVGSAVVLCDASGLGPMVTMRDLDRLRPLNFGIRTLDESISVDAIAREIGKYDSQDAALVSQRIRATAGRDAVIDELLGLYEEVIAEHAAQGRSDWAGESRAASGYLRWVASRLKENDRLQGERDWIEAEHNMLHSRFCAREQEIEVLKSLHESETARLQEERDRIEAEHNMLQTRVAAREHEIEVLKSGHEIEAARLQGERDSMEAEHSALQSGSAARQREIEVLESRHAREAARLEEQVSQSNREAARLEEQISQSNRKAARLEEQISQSNRKAARLEEQISQSNRKAVNLAGELAAKSAELARMTNTLGWRLLSRYGKIKYRFLLPAYRQFKRLFRSKA